YGADRRVARRRARSTGSQGRRAHRVHGGVGQSGSELAETGIRRDEAQRPGRRGEEGLMKRALVLIALAAGVSGCATIKGWFTDSKAENIEPPTALVEFPPTINVQKVWSERIGKGAQHTGARM